ncbi:LacI family DNA-binding transcriptional regulator [Breznakiella homolactica]|uniref:LacI family DNA-binding transcriptional regulator n=1 Tax=Breznakiella homolactica TaxID=2798577 RepID=A0A7T7XJQ2_9SPIR|nr:LacI family DNA-binding transcriptional regulator [Breznakiella homolactica]QQO07482.1 LacI family transcriptional regulator [Breznakiella homolactica]
MNIKDVAVRAGVSVSTAYKVFDTAYTTSTDIREKVLAAARDIGYIHKASYRNGSSGETKLIAHIVTESTASNGFHSFITKELMDELERYGYRLTVLYTNWSQEREKEDFEILADHKIDGIIFTPARFDKNESIERIIQNGMPVLQLFGSAYDHVDTLLFDDELGAYTAVKHLLQCGHTKIMMLSRHTSRTMDSRIKGYERAFAEAGVPLDPEMFCVLGFDESVKNMISGVIRKKEPTAIVSVSEGISLCTLKAVHELKLSIPNDISLIAYDDFPWLAAFDISAVSHPFKSVGTLGAQLIHNRVQEQYTGLTAPPSTLVLDPQLILRDSVKILR